MRRVLIISPHFPPTNAPDMQRVRLALPYLKGTGWDAEVLAVQPEQVAAPQDAWLAAGLPDHVPVHRVRALDRSWGRVPGLGSLAFRCKGPLSRQGDALLASGKFDLVYFSTTQFGVHTLGPRWWNRFKVPFAMDYQDPWVSDYYREHPEQTPPGGRLKFALADRLGRFEEPRVLRACAGLTSVSVAYPQQLRRHYPWLRADLPVEVMSFPGDDRDFERVKSDDVRQHIFEPADGRLHWVYVGRGGQDMAVAARGFFGALRSVRESQPELLGRLKIHFIGTSYAAAGNGRPTLAPLAAEFGLADIVEESPDRIPYSETLRCLLDANALFILGSDDPGYTASKLYPYLLSGRPLLGVFHEQSSAAKIMADTRGGVSVTFNSETTSDELAARIRRQWLETAAWNQPSPFNRAAFAPFDASHQAARLAAFFERCVRPEAPVPR